MAQGDRESEEEGERQPHPVTKAMVRRLVPTQEPLAAGENAERVERTEVRNLNAINTQKIQTQRNPPP